MKTYLFTTATDPRSPIGDLKQYEHEALAHEEAMRLARTRREDVRFYAIAFVSELAPPSRIIVSDAPLTPLEECVKEWTPAAQEKYGPNPTLIQILTTAVIATIHCTTGIDPRPRKKPAAHHPSDD